MMKFKFYNQKKIIIAIVSSMLFLIILAILSIVFLWQDALLNGIISASFVTFITIFLGLVGFNSYYVFEENYLVLKLGFLPIKIAYTDFYQLRFFKQFDSLVLTHAKARDVNNIRFSKIVINPSCYDAFINETLKRNKNIIYEILDKIEEN